MGKELCVATFKIRRRMEYKRMDFTKTEGKTKKKDTVFTKKMGK